MLTLVDIFTTIFAYDGYDFATTRVHRAVWTAMRTVTRPVPDHLRHQLLSLGGALLLPGTLVFWLALEVAAFGMIFLPGIAHGYFAVSDHAGRGPVGAFYLSGGDITSLTFGDYVARTTFFRAMVDLETAIGLATFTLALTYVLSAFDALAKLYSLYARVRRNAVEPHLPSTVLERRYRTNDASYYSEFLRAAVDELQEYNQALRRFPVAFYFHTRDLDRATPTVLSALGTLLELSRWGLPRSERVTEDPNLLALMEEYRATLLRLRTIFLHAPAGSGPESPSLSQFLSDEEAPGTDAGSFHELVAEAARASAVEDTDPADVRFERFTDWLPFHHLVTSTVVALSEALGYEPDEVRAARSMPEHGPS